MGIVRFFHWFKNSFNQDIIEIKKDETVRGKLVCVDNLMIDLNGIFHNSAQKIYEYGNFKKPIRLLTKSKDKNIIKKQVEVFRDICENIELLLRIVKPSKRLILCTDGPAPLSKQKQQRSRRFKSAISNHNNGFDSNSITPGTKFMDYLSKYIDWYICKRISEDEYWQGIQVIFSNEKTPGEGEHTIINYIRNYGDLSDTYCIHGLDADLIMLSLGTHVRNFYILREDMYNFDNEFFLIDIGKIREKMKEMYDWNTKSYIPKRAINDFIFMCFTIGNDFLPHIPSIEIIQNGIEILLEIYMNVGMNYGHLTKKTKSGVEIIPNVLKIFMGMIGQSEKDLIEYKMNSKHNFFKDKILENNCIINGSKYVLNIETYKEEYYKNNFPDGITIENICHEYIEGMQWVIYYYTKGVPSWTWFYPYHYAPFASDIATYIDTYVKKSYSMSLPYTPFQQLLCVLPPKSSHLIPRPLSELITDENSPLKEYYPSNFKVDLSGKKNEWEGIVILPILNYENIKLEYFNSIENVRKQDLKRNIIGKSFIYFVINKPYTLHNYYGDIKYCKVIRKSFDI